MLTKVSNSSEHGAEKWPNICLFKKGVIRNFAKFTGKHLCHSLFFEPVPESHPATLLKEGSNITVFL